MPFKLTGRREVKQRPYFCWLVSYLTPMSARSNAQANRAIDFHSMKKANQCDKDRETER
jgi:hypothetical protein